MHLCVFHWCNDRSTISKQKRTSEQTQMHWVVIWQQGLDGTKVRVPDIIPSFKTHQTFYSVIFFSKPNEKYLQKDISIVMACLLLMFTRSYQLRSEQRSKFTDCRRGSAAGQPPPQGFSHHLVIKLITSFLVRLINNHYHSLWGGSSGVCLSQPSWESRGTISRSENWPLAASRSSLGFFLLLWFWPTWTATVVTDIPVVLWVKLHRSQYFHVDKCVFLPSTTMM